MIKLAALGLAAIFVVVILALFIFLPLVQSIAHRRNKSSRYGPPPR